MKNYKISQNEIGRGLMMLILIVLIVSCNNNPQSTNQNVEPISKKINEPEVVWNEQPSIVEETQKMEEPETKTKPTAKKEKPIEGKKEVVKTTKGKPENKSIEDRPLVSEPKSTTTVPVTTDILTSESVNSDPTPSKPVATTTQPTKPKVISKPLIKSPVEIPPSNTPKKPELSHELWNQLTSKYISATGKVNYASLKNNKATLNQYLSVLENNPPQSNWSRNKTMAYWINAYNAYTIKLIIDHYPTSSITNLEGGDPWRKQLITIGGSKYSLNQIEKDLLIKRFSEPRVHFAVNCAAKSCPPILNKAWTERNLEANFERSSKNFINNAEFNDLNNSKNINLSKIFEWYASDFGDVISFINKYANTPIKENAKISYKEYNWNLNE